MIDVEVADSDTFMLFEAEAKARTCRAIRRVTLRTVCRKPVVFYDTLFALGARN